MLFKTLDICLIIKNCDRKLTKLTKRHYTKDKLDIINESLYIKQVWLSLIYNKIPTLINQEQLNN